MNLQIGFLCEIKNVSRIKFDIQFGLTADMRAKCATNHPLPLFVDGLFYDGVLMKQIELLQGNLKQHFPGNCNF